MSPESIGRLKEESLARGDARLAAICELARSGQLSQDYLQALPRPVRVELGDWTQSAAREHIAPLLRIEETLPLGEPMQSDPAPARVDANRNEQLIELLETGTIRLQNAAHMNGQQRNRAVVRFARRVARALITAEHVHSVGQFLEQLFERDPAELRERAAIAREDGDIDRAQRLEDAAAKIEARRGNG
jgi:hypothetical protein